VQNRLHRANYYHYYLRATCWFYPFERKFEKGDYYKSLCQLVGHWLVCCPLICLHNNMSNCEAKHFVVSYEIKMNLEGFIYMCPSLTFWVQLTILAILRIWYRLKALCLKITVSKTGRKY